MNDIKDITNALIKFRDDRDWMQFHDSKNLACAISIEAAELNELFLWKTIKESEAVDKELIKGELADIFAFSFLLASKVKGRIVNLCHGCRVDDRTLACMCFYRCAFVLDSEPNHDKDPPEYKIRTVDKFQGQEAPVVIYSMTASSPEDVPRGMSFLYNPSRFNVASSRAKSVFILVASPKLLEPNCRTIDQMKWANVLCRYKEMAREIQI